MPSWDGTTYQTPSGRIELRNPALPDPLPRYLPTHGENDGYPLRLMTAPSLYALNASFYERDDLRVEVQKKG
jgi:hypothetical protein